MMLGEEVGHLLIELAETGVLYVLLMRSLYIIIERIVSPDEGMNLEHAVLIIASMRPNRRDVPIAAFLTRETRRT